MQQGLLSDAPVGQKLYLYKSELDSNIPVLQHHILGWPFPDKYSLDIGYSVRGFKFVFENLNDTPKTFIIPSQDLINTESGQEQTTSVQTSNDFNPNYKGIDDNIKKYKYNNYYYINESYFLKDTFITALNQNSDTIYGSISYFNKKAENEIFKIVSAKEFLKFYIDKNITKNSLTFQLTSINGKIPKLKDNKIHNLSLMKIGEKRKRQMAETKETVIICAQQSFEITGGLNLIQIEIEDDRV